MPLGQPLVLVSYRLLQAWIPMRIAKLVLFVLAWGYLMAACTIAAVGLHDSVVAADAIVVLGNTVGPDGRPSPRLKARLDCALAVYRRGLAPLLIVSGGIGREGYDEGAVMARYLERQGVPAAAIVVDSSGWNTAATAVDVAHIARAHQLRSVLLASQYFHLARARLALSRAGVPVAGTVHARYFEPRDAYSLAREVVAFAVYYLGLKGPATGVRQVGRMDRERPVPCPFKAR